MADLLKHLELQGREHAAWLDVGAECERLGLDMNAGGNAEQLHNAIVKWGEELVQLRLGDPEKEHAERALSDRRAAYEGRWERGEY